MHQIEYIYMVISLYGLHGSLYSTVCGCQLLPMQLSTFPPTFSNLKSFRKQRINVCVHCIYTTETHTCLIYLKNRIKWFILFTPFSLNFHNKYYIPWICNFISDIKRYFYMSYWTLRERLMISDTEKMLGNCSNKKRGELLRIFSGCSDNQALIYNFVPKQQI